MIYKIILLVIFTPLLACCGENNKPAGTVAQEETAVKKEVEELPAAPEVPQAPAEILRLIKAYPDFLDSADSEYLYWNDGTKMKYDDGISGKDFETLLNEPCLLDQMLQPYPVGKDYTIPIAENNDPGRIRYEPFFFKMYGKSKSAVRKNLTTIDWFGRKLKVSKLNGIDKKLLKIKKELLKLPKKYHKYFMKTAGTFNWRNIAGTSRKSVHSFGIAIDINTSYSNYWRWSKPDDNGKYPYKNKIPLEIVEVFEKYGFIWGGKWYHYDTMHFEYRPELLM